jgi:hypothetical protein
VLRRQRSVGWAWTKARDIMKSRANSTHAKLTVSVLLTNSYDSDVEEISSWRDSLAAFNHRSLARQICDQFYDLSILTERCGAAAERPVPDIVTGVTTSSHCVEEAKAQLMRDGEEGGRKTFRARILSAVLPKRLQRSAVLISLKSRAA